MGRSRAFNRAVIASMGLLPYCSVTCAAAGSSSRTRRYGPALSVVTSTGAGPYLSARVKNRRAAAVSRCSGPTHSAMQGPTTDEAPIQRLTQNTLTLMIG
jgi:hypothetical protein